MTPGLATTGTAAGLLLFMLASCTTPAPQAATKNRQKNPLEITPGPELAKQIKVGQPRWQAVSGTLSVAGRVEADETRMARVSAPVTGRIVDIAAFEGEPVKRGQVLATIYSTELSSAQSALLKASSQRQLAERAVARAHQLLDAGVIGQAELQRREAELQQASADLSSSREQLRVLGLTQDSIDKLQATRILSSSIQIIASIDGIILERKATIGQVVQAAEIVFVVADLSQVWLVADVPEQSAGSIHIGKSVEAEVPALPGEKISGKLSFVSSIVNPETRTVRTRMNLPNPHRLFKPSMMATITLVDGAERRLVVPGTAIVREGNEDNVFVQTAPNTFVLRHVTSGNEFRDLRAIVEGVRQEDRIVVDGAFHLNNERKRRALRSSEEGED